LTVVPIALIWIIPTIVLSIVSLPVIAGNSYWTVFVTGRLGWKIKIIFLFSLLVPLLIWPPFAVIGSIIGGFFFGLFRPMIETFKSGENILISGLDKVFRESFIYVKEFRQLVFSGFFTFCLEYRKPFNGQPFDIDFLPLFLGLFVGLCGVLFIGFSWTVIGIVKLLPCMVRGYIKLSQWYFGLHSGGELAAFFFVWIFGNILMPITAILFILLYVLFGFYLGAYSSVVAYQDGVEKAYIAMWEWSLAFNKNTNKWIMEGDVNFVVRNS